MKDRFLKQMIVFGVIIAGSAGIGWGVYFNHAMAEANSAHLTCPGITTGCTILGHFQTVDFFSFAALAVAVAGGALVAIKSWARQKNILATNTGLVEVVKKLRGDEKTVYDAIAAAEGTMFQSDIVKQLGFSKVKASRIIDRLEAKGLVERRRRGMANLVVLKRLV